MIEVKSSVTTVGRDHQYGTTHKFTMYFSEGKSVPAHMMCGECEKFCLHTTERSTEVFKCEEEYTPRSPSMKHRPQKCNFTIRFDRE